MKQLYVIGLITLAALIIGLAQAEQMTFSTYYPAPAGVYNQMVTRCLGVGDQDGGGSIDYNDAPDPSIAAQENDLWVAGQLGIGTTNPTTQVEVYDSSAGGNSFLIWDPNSAIRIGIENGTNYIESGSTPASGSKADLRFTDMLNTECWMIIKDDGNVGIGTPNPQEILDVDSTSSGFLPPRMTDAQLTAIEATATEGSVAYNRTDEELNYRDSTGWQPMGGGGVFGVWNDRNQNGIPNAVSSGVAYTAATDGFVVAYNSNFLDGVVYIETPVGTRRTNDRGGQATEQFKAGVMCPVRKGDTWIAYNADTVSWMPLGN